MITDKVNAKIHMDTNAPSVELISAKAKHFLLILRLRDFNSWLYSNKRKT